MEKLLMDVADCTMKRISDNKIAFFGKLQLSGISQKITEDKVKGGFGNKTLAILRSDKEIELTIRSAVWNTDFLEIVNGTAFSTTSSTSTLFTKEEDLLCDGTKVTITGTVSTGASPVIKVVSSKGVQYTGTNSTGKDITFTGGATGDYYTCLYQTDVSAPVLNIESDTFAENFYLEFHTIEFDIDTNLIDSDLYWVFDKVVPSGSWDLNFEAGKTISPEIKCTVLVPSASNVIGRVIEKARS